MKKKKTKIKTKEAICTRVKDFNFSIIEFPNYYNSVSYQIFFFAGIAGHTASVGLLILKGWFIKAFPKKLTSSSL